MTSRSACISSQFVTSSMSVSGSSEWNEIVCVKFTSTGAVDLVVVVVHGLAIDDRSQTTVPLLGLGTIVVLHRFFVGGYVGVDDAELRHEHVLARVLTVGEHERSHVPHDVGFGLVAIPFGRELDQ